MNTLRQHLRILLSVTTLAAPLMLGMLSHEAIAAERKIARTGVNGNAVQRTAMRNHQSGTVSSNATRTAANGAVSTRSSTGVLDREAGTWTRSATSTGPNGKTSTLNAEVVKTDDGYTRSATRVGPNGQTATTNMEMVRTADGRSINTTFTGPNGNTVTTNTTGSYDPETQTATRSTTVTGANGQTSTSVTTTTFTPAP